MIWEKLLGGLDLRLIKNKGHLIFLESLQQMNTFYRDKIGIVDMVIGYLSQFHVEMSREALCCDLANNCIESKLKINLDSEIQSFDIILDLLYSLKQVSEEHLIQSSEEKALAIENHRLLLKAEILFMYGSYEKAFSLFSWLSNNKNGRSMYYLGEYYEYSYSTVNVDVEMAQKWRERGAKAGDLLAALKLISRKSCKFIFQHVLQLAESGDVAAQFEAGNTYFCGRNISQNYEEAVKWFRSSAEQGEARAQNNLGECYRDGYGVGKDDKEAVKWFRRSAEQGEARAQNNWGECYRDGYGVEKDNKEAVNWFKKSARQGNAIAQKNLGWCYDWGIGIERDAEEAVKWFRRSAEQGDAWAQNWLGDYYCQEIDDVAAVEWFSKAAKQGNANAQNSLGEYYHYGKVVVQDCEEAVKWFKRSAEQGNARAQNNLGECYRDGDGVEQNYKEAVAWFKKAVEKENIEALNNLGDCYYWGQGVEQSYKESAKWYQKAAEQGSIYAQQQLKNISL